MADISTATITATSEVAIVQESVYVWLTTYTTTDPNFPWTTVPTTDENGSTYDLTYFETSTALTTETLSSSVELSTQTYYGALPTTSISRITTTVTNQPLGTKSTGATNATNTPAHLSRALSTGAKAGIGIGVTFGFLSLAAITLYAIFRTQRMRRIKTPGKQPNQDPSHKHELDSSADLSRMDDAAVELEGSAMPRIPVIKRKPVGLTNNASSAADGKEVVHEK